MDEIEVKTETLFVTCHVQLYDTIPDERSVQWRIRHFITLAETGIPLCVFACDLTRPLIEAECVRFPNVHIFPIAFDQCVLMRTISESDAPLPKYRNESKDTKEYMTLMHGKMDFMHRAMELYPLSKYPEITRFAWIDFSIAYIFHNPKETCARLLEYSAPIKTNIEEEEDALLIPGCIDSRKDPPFDKIHWRFCGGFFVGGRRAIQDFYARSVAHLPPFLDQSQTILWEVNFWAWLEVAAGWSPTWIPADHNDSILFSFSHFHI